MSRAGWSTWTSCNKLFRLFSFVFFYSLLKRIPCNSWTSRYFHLELLSHIFVQPLSQEFLNFLGSSTWTSSNKFFWLCLFNLFSLIRNAHHTINELLTVIKPNFSLFRFRNRKSLSFLYTSNLSNFLFELLCVFFLEMWKLEFC